MAKKEIPDIILNETGIKPDCIEIGQTAYANYQDKYVRCKVLSFVTNSLIMFEIIKTKEIFASSDFISSENIPF